MPELTLTDEQIVELLDVFQKSTLPIAPPVVNALLELQARRAAEKKEWLVTSKTGSIRCIDEAQADSHVLAFGNLWRKQYRIAAGPWIDAEPASDGKEQS